MDKKELSDFVITEDFHTWLTTNGMDDMLEQKYTLRGVSGYCGINNRGNIEDPRHVLAEEAPDGTVAIVKFRVENIEGRSPYAYGTAVIPRNKSGVKKDITFEVPETYQKRDEYIS